MADIKFSEFPKATTSKDSDEIAILQDGVNKMIPSPVLESKIINKTVSRVIEQGGASLNVINLKGVVPTYADLALITPAPELNDAYQVESDGLVYVYTDNGFQAEGEGIVVQTAPTGIVEEGNTQAVSGGEVYDFAKDVELIKTGAVKDWILGTTYLIGDVVRHNGLLWVATTTITSAVPGSASVWKIYDPYQKSYTLVSTHYNTFTIDLVTNQFIFTGSSSNRIITSEGVIFIPAQTVNIIEPTTFLTLVYDSETSLVKVYNSNLYSLKANEYLIGSVLNINSTLREVFGFKSYKLIDSTGTNNYPYKPTAITEETAYNHIFSKYAAGRTETEKIWLNKAIIDLEFYNIGEDEAITLYGLGKNYGSTNLTYLGFIYHRPDRAPSRFYSLEFGNVFSETYDPLKHSGIKTYTLNLGTDISTDLRIIGKVTIDWDAVPNGQRIVESTTNVVDVNSLILRNFFINHPVYNSGLLGKTRFATSKGFNDYFNSPVMPSYSSAEGVHSMIPKSPYQDYAQWLIEWDELITNAPAGYSITKELLTDSVPMDVGVNNGEIWAYKFKPSLLRAGDPTGGNAQTLPKIFVNCSIHGYEKTPSFVTYEFLKYMFSNWKDNEFLEYLRFNVEFIIIPVANPYGWNVNGGIGIRQNFNGVDLNRNFPAFWQSSQTNAGASPLSEVESQAINTFMETEITPQTILGIDFHNFHGVTETDPKNYNLIWVVNMGTSLGQSCSNVFIKEVTPKFKEKSPLIPQSEDYYVGRTNSWQGNGFAGMQMRALGAQYGCTFEVSQNFRFDPDFKGHDSNAITFGVESFGNFLRVFLANFLEEYNRDI